MKKLLVINSGSTSLKYKLFNFTNLDELAEGNIQNIGARRAQADNHRTAFKIMLEELEKRGVDLASIKAVGHRVVHGGEEFQQPTIITPTVLKRLEKYNKLAPLHNPANLLGIKASNKLLYHIPDVHGNG